MLRGPRARFLLVRARRRRDEGERGAPDCEHEPLCGNVRAYRHSRLKIIRPVASTV
jgi:hypothetical protein